MDVKGDIALPIPPAVAAGASGHATSKTADAAPAPAAKRTGVSLPDQEAVKKVLREALDIEPVPPRELRIEFERDLNVIVVKVLDKDSGEIIRQVPMPESLAVAKQIRAQIRRMAGEQRGFAVDQEV